jgi:hypothetical protein
VKAGAPPLRLHFIGVYLCGLVVEEKNEKMQEG